MAANHVRRHHELFHLTLLHWQVIHQFEHQIFQNHAKAACTDFALQREFGDGFDRVVREAQANVLKFEEALVLLEKRVGQRSLGFHTEVAPATPQRRNTQLLEQVQPGDLIRYGLIPEFVGRLPVAGVMSDLDKGALVKILTEPKNALLKQYQRLFEFENVRLRFTDDAIETVAELALQRKVGARGLRMILEDLMLELMYHLPMQQRKVKEFVVTADMVRGHEINWSLLEKAG